MNALRRKMACNSHRFRHFRTILMVLCCANIGSLSGALIQAEPAFAVPSVWSVTPSPYGNGELLFSGVSCVNSITCVAFGRDVEGKTLAESWNGSSWSVTPSPTPSDPTYIYGVSCSGPTYCVAVGNDFGSSGTQTLVETWNGKTWSVTPSPNSGSGSYLYGVSCSSSNSCEAVGRFVNSSSTNQTLIESWDGSAWSVVPSPNRGSGDNQLNGVSCTSATSCVAVGWEGNAAGKAKIVIESWDGTSWSLVPSPTEERAANSMVCHASAQ